VHDSVVPTPLAPGSPKHLSSPRRPLLEASMLFSGPFYDDLKPFGSVGLSNAGLSKGPKPFHSSFLPALHDLVTAFLFKASTSPLFSQKGGGFWSERLLLGWATKQYHRLNPDWGERQASYFRSFEYSPEILNPKPPLNRSLPVKL